MDRAADVVDHRAGWDRGEATHRPQRVDTSNSANYRLANCLRPKQHLARGPQPRVEASMQRLSAKTQSAGRFAIRSRDPIREKDNDKYSSGAKELAKFGSLENFLDAWHFQLHYFAPERHHAFRWPLALRP